MKSQKRLRFEKIASNRVQRIIDTLTSLSNCSNKNNYEYSKEDTDKMFKIIKDKLRETEMTFNTKLSKSDSNIFKF
jgi:Holliday junction resolvase RusA-like endonuclease